MKNDKLRHIFTGEGAALFTRRNRHIGKVVALLVLLVVIGIASSGCVQGLQAIGWSGGAVSDGTLFVGSKEGKLVAINIADEGRRWSEALRASGQSGGFGCVPGLGGSCVAGAPGVAIYGTPVVAGDLVYIGGYNGKIYAFASETLATRWIYPREGNLEPLVGGMVAAKGRLYFGGSDGKIYALDAATGDKLAEYTTGEKVWSTPAVNEDTLYIGSFDKKLYALAADGLSLKWAFPAEGAIISAPLVHDGTVYFGSFDRYLYAVNTADGSLRWRFISENWFWATPVIIGDTIYAGSLDGKVYALKADTGAKIAEFDLRSPVSSSPVVVNDNIVFASGKGVLFTIDTKTNEYKLLVDIKVDVYGPLCASNDIVYIPTQDLTIHRVNVVTGAVLRSIALSSKD